MGSNNAIDLKSSGIVSYDGSGTFSALSSPLSISNGGTGDSSLTAYAVLCGGTTSTSAIQPVAGLGSQNDILTSNGAGALPTFQTLTPSKSTCISMQTGTGNLSASSTYFLSQANALTFYTTSTNAGTVCYIPVAGTISAFSCAVTVQSTKKTANGTLILRLNNSSDTTLTSALSFANALTQVNGTPSISVSAGDFIEFKLTTPSWSGQGPKIVAISISVLIT